MASGLPFVEQTETASNSGSWFRCGKRKASTNGFCCRKRAHVAGEQRRLLEINTASIEDLQRLPAIGEKKAIQISEMRDDWPLESLYRLNGIPGIGGSTLEKIGRYTYVDPEYGLKSGGENQDAELRRKCSKLLTGAWNVRNLGEKALDSGRAAEVAAIIAEYDVVALLELRDTEVIEGLLDTLGRETWDVTVSSEVGTDHHKEVYAFLYRKSAVQLLKSEILSDRKDKWVREPFMAYFRAQNGFDFVVAAIHVVWGKSIHERRAEVEALGDKLKRIQSWNGEKDVILLGDFNLEPDDKGWDVARSAGWIPLLEGDGLKSMVGDTHLYDNIWVHRQHTANSEWLGASGVIRFDHLFFGPGKKDTKQAIKELSDHRPTWALFATDVDDDDGSLAGLPLFRTSSSSSWFPSMNIV